MRKVGIAVLVAFGVTLAVVIGNRMSAEAMAVVVGVVCGVAAGIPMALLIMLVLNRAGQRRQDPSWETQQASRHGAYPPVVVIQGGTPAPDGLLPPYYATRSIVQESAERQFRIVGEHED